MVEKSQIRLRAVELEDVNLLYEWENNQSLFQFGNPSAPFSRHQLKTFVESCTGDLYVDLQLRLIIEAVNDGHLIPVGLIDAFEFDPFNLRAGIGIMIHNRFREMGYATEALRKFVDYLFTQWGLHQVTASVTVTNNASIALFQNSGFDMIGLRKEWIKTAIGFVDVKEYQLINRK